MKRGPKPQPEAHRATEVIRVRVTPAEKAIVREMAADEGVNLSDILRSAVSEYRPKRRM